MNGLRRGYRRSESSGYYRELFIKKYIKARPKRDFLGMIHWVHDDEPQVEKPPREPLDSSITLLIVLLTIIACFALAVICALPFKLLTW